MRQTVRLGSVRGIPIGLHWSLLLVAALLSLQLYANLLPELVPGRSSLGYAVVGGTIAVAFLMSILAHELGHALVAERLGVRVRRVTLWLLGGVAELSTEAPRPSVERRIAGAGPAVSVGLGIVGGVAATALALAGAPELVVAGIAWLAIINLFLAAFNLLPAAPLDGGRILRAALWRHHGDRVRATITASRAGQVVGWALVAAGVLEILTSTGTGLWTALVGWFVLSAAHAERERAERQRPPPPSGPRGGSGWDPFTRRPVQPALAPVVVVSRPSSARRLD
jgi:Zn-dependent protease